METSPFSAPFSWGTREARASASKASGCFMGGNPAFLGRNRESIYEAGATFKIVFAQTKLLNLTAASRRQDEVERHRSTSGQFKIVIRQADREPGRDQSSIRALRPMRTTSLCSRREAGTGGRLNQKAQPSFGGLAFPRAHRASRPRRRNSS